MLKVILVQVFCSLKTEISRRFSIGFRPNLREFFPSFSLWLPLLYYVETYYLIPSCFFFQFWNSKTRKFLQALTFEVPITQILLHRER